MVLTFHLYVNATESVSSTFIGMHGQQLTQADDRLCNMRNSHRQRLFCQSGLLVHRGESGRSDRNCDINRIL